MTTIHSKTPATVTGVQLMRGIGARAARGFWIEALSQVIRRPRAIFGLCWLGLVLTLAIIGPFIANGHPLIMRTLPTSPGGPVVVTYPFLNYLKPTDLLLPAGALVVLAWCLMPAIGDEAARRRWSRILTACALAGLVGYAALSLAGVAVPMFPVMVAATAALIIGARLTPRNDRFATLFVLALFSGLLILLGEALVGYLGQREIPAWARSLKRRDLIEHEAPALIGLACTLLCATLPVMGGLVRRTGFFAAAALIVATCLGQTWARPLATFDYREREARGEVQATYAVIPWSPGQRRTDLNVRPPGTRFWEATNRQPPAGADDPAFILGTDSLGQDVLTQIIRACRLSISIGLVSTGIAVLLGVTIGSIMGYFGGWIDMLLYRVVEVFMAVPVLFLLIVAAAVLPRNIYVIMAIIGCFTWMGSARFIRAEFMKLRNQDFVQSARAVGLPLRSILFRHMLPNGVTPVLVDASFAIAAAILAETTLSYLGLGPEGQPSWGQLLSDATGNTGVFLWWLAIFPGAAIFMTVLSYNLIGEALRDAIDPKLKKARV